MEVIAKNVARRGNREIASAVRRSRRDWNILSEMRRAIDLHCCHPRLSRLQFRDFAIPRFISIILPT
jgi:hypothetical protein